ncbi:MAG: ion transporter [Cycloclasticus sp.]|nr:ion transporter [Cycloclasticus sp.]
MIDSGAKNYLDSRAATWIITSLILYSVVCFSFETLPDLSDSTVLFFLWSERLVVVLFTAEYLYRIYSAKNKLRYIFSFYGLVDLIAILPFYLALVLDLRALRLLRLLRILRLLKLTRYNRALNRFAKAMVKAKEELVIILSAILVLLYFAAFGIYYFEHEVQPEVYTSIFDALWWAVVSLTTVGYGDMYPITLAGRLFTFIILILGLVFVAVPTGIVASALSAVRREEEAANNSNTLGKPEA